MKNSNMKKLILAFITAAPLAAWAQNNTNEALYYYCQQGKNQYQESVALSPRVAVKYHQGPFMQITLHDEQLSLEPVLLSQLEQAGIDRSCGAYLLSRAQISEKTRGEIAARVLFDFDKASLNAQSEHILNKLNQHLTKLPEASLLVVGNTDAKGRDSYNFDLGLKRAQTVARYLDGTHEKVAASRSDGESHPVSSNSNAFGRELNRRVDISLSQQD